MLWYAIYSVQIFSQRKQQINFMKWLYAQIIFFSILVPFIFSFHPKLKFNKNFGAFFPANILAAIVFIVWDVFFTRLAVWGFNPKYVTGNYLFNLPLEEISFFICIPFACVFVYHCLNQFYIIEWKPKTEKIFIDSISLLLFSTGIYFYNRLYTSSTFISLSILLIALKYVVKVKWLPKLITIYPVLLIPFCIVNGILTGSGLQEPVVWYNNTENLGIRLLTIPVEDIFYGFELILLNVFFYEYFKSKFSKNEKGILLHSA
jgi:lycopene cyclase domain-containing protein